MKRGYSVFGKAYEIMLRNDIHDINSIDHKIISNMILLDNKSYDYLYKSKVNRLNMDNHELYKYSQQFKGNNDKEMLCNVINNLSKIASDFNVDFEDMLFGGTEKEILNRGTDWCGDMARVACVLLMCLNIPCRMVNLVNLNKAYNGHVVVEAYYENKWGVADPIYGFVFYIDKPIDAYQLLNDKSLLEEYEQDYRDLFTAVAISEYNPLDLDNDYIISRPNDYYKSIINTNHNGKWLMNEDK